MIRRLLAHIRHRLWLCEECWRPAIQLSNNGLRCEKHRI